ncbi:MAG: metallophosphoesterase family protein, partial [Ignavibacteriaceae bacterium]
MKIAHISDLHFTTFFKKSNYGSIQYLLEYALNHNADHIVITGDLTDNADKNDFLILRTV